jgi:sigma-B regulation protein RsbU (phosphoserine phosphatase)
MKVLIADDDAVSLRRLEVTLPKWGYDPLAARNGSDAWGILKSPERPPLALIDWMMPGMTGPEICRALRETPSSPPSYVILVTARTSLKEVVEGLEAGADDYVTKPYRNDELRARLGVGRRIVTLERQLAERVTQLEVSLSQVRRLQGLLPICSYCKRIRSDKDYWEQIDVYIAEHAGVLFSHGVCPSCLATMLGPELDALKKR